VTLFLLDNVLLPYEFSAPLLFWLFAEPAPCPPPPPPPEPLIGLLALEIHPWKSVDLSVLIMHDLVNEVDYGLPSSPQCTVLIIDNMDPCWGRQVQPEGVLLRIFETLDLPGFEKRFHLLSLS